MPWREEKLCPAVPGQRPGCRECKRKPRSCGHHFLIKMHQRQKNVKDSSLGYIAFNFDLSAMFLDNSMYHGKAEPGSEILRRERRIEDPCNIFLFYPFTGIANGNA